MGADKGKKQKLGQAEEENNGVDHVDRDLVLSIEKLQEIQDELEKINEEASEKVLEVEQQYNEILFLSHPALSELLTDEDQKIFKYLNNLEVEDFKDVKSGYSITFNFKPNPYFQDTMLTKTVTFLEEGTTITATSIKWKESMGIPNGVTEDKKGNKRSHSEESFFTWFYDTQHKGDMVEIHDEVAEIIKDDLWPNPLTYFNNDADEEEFEMDDDDDEDEEKGSDESEEGDDDGEQDDIDDD